MQDGGDDIGAVQHELRIATALASELTASLDRVHAALQRAVQDPLKRGVQDPVEALSPMDAHRAAHRRGTLSPLDCDPELQAFVRARLDRMTFKQLATAVADHFPPGRRTSVSALHRWYRRQPEFSSKGVLT